MIPVVYSLALQFLIALFIFLSVHKCCYITLYKILVHKNEVWIHFNNIPERAAMIYHVFNCKAR